MEVQEDERICLRRTTITVTMRCTLRCKLCAIDIPNYTVPLPEYSFEEIKKELDRYFELVDYVEWLQLSGGEPLLNHDLSKMVSYIMNYGNKFDKLIIFANGTVLPSEELMQVLKEHKNRIFFFLSNYGEKSVKLNEMQRMFEKDGIAYTEKKYYGENQYCGGWIDYGSWERQNLSIGELEQRFKTCGMSEMKFSVLQNGLLHLCRRSWRGMEKGCVDVRDEEYLDIFAEDMSLEEMRRHIRKMMSVSYLAACDHCSGEYNLGNTKKRYPAAEQV